MILIISEELDASTNKVLDWTLDTSELIRVNKNDLKIVAINYQEEEVLFEFKEKIVSSRDVSAFWYRRGYIDYDYHINADDSVLGGHIYYHLNDEWNEIIRFFTEIFSNNNETKSLGVYQVKDRKLTQLDYAQKIGLNIPKTFITSSKKELLSFQENCMGNIITKGISSSPSFTYANNSLEGYTEVVSNKFLDSISGTFFPSFFQENIEKQYELRIFYLRGKFYSMAIFSQNNEQTKTDVRKYDDAKPNKVVSYKLPKEVENKLHKFMLKMDLDTGSIDMIVDKNDEFYFLEVNPNGQFGMVSTPCNYYIEREIAKELT